MTFPWFPAQSEASVRSASAAALSNSAPSDKDFYLKRKVRSAGQACFAENETFLHPPPLRLKVRSIHDKKCMRLEPAGVATWGLFGADLVERLLWSASSANFLSKDASSTPDETGTSSSLETDTLCVAEGEFDAMSIYQETGMPTVSVPLGANSLPPALLPFFERFKKIYLVSSGILDSVR